VRELSSYEKEFNSEWLLRQSCLNLQVKQHCEQPQRDKNFQVHHPRCVFMQMRFGGSAKIVNCKGAYDLKMDMHGRNM